MLERLRNVGGRQAYLCEIEVVDHRDRIRDGFDDERGLFGEMVSQSRHDIRHPHDPVVGRGLGRSEGASPLLVPLASGSEELGVLGGVEVLAVEEGVELPERQFAADLVPSVCVYVVDCGSVSG